ncbi:MULTISPECIES: hypothetical protein [unclassified Chryseobacterium]|uniref:hypothetical protein n=1 Tax=unclassified Chryseobacterium TaxID=2593645 RepID=UPI00300FDFA2
MYRKIAFFICFIYSTYCFSQNRFEEIELSHSNAMVVGSAIKIIIKPTKVGKHKMRIIVESKNNYFTKKLSKKEYAAIDNAVLKINPKNLYNISNNGKDTIQTNCLDGFNTSITVFKNSKKGSYSLDCLSKMDKYNNRRKDFWYAAKLISKVGGVEIKELED